VEPLPLASGHRIVLSPEDPSTRITITSDSGPIFLFDGRNKAQNGWFVVCTLIPADKTGDVVVWHIRPNVIAEWTRPPVVGYNQVGYTPEREKVAALELDPQFKAPKVARVLRLTPEGDYQEVRASISLQCVNRESMPSNTPVRGLGLFASRRMLMTGSGGHRSIRICRSRWTT
jgi:hypothetical protein